MLTVKERGHFVATLRYVHVTLMETLAAWVPTTPEVEAKLLLGEHIWDVAQHADSLGKRTFELRLPLQHSVRAAEPYVEFLAEIRAIEPTTSAWRPCTTWSCRASWHASGATWSRRTSWWMRRPCGSWSATSLTPPG